MRLRRLAAVALLGAFAASCGPLVPPAGIPAPPAPGGGRPAHPPVSSTAPGPVRIDREPVIEVGLAWDLDSLALAPVGGMLPWRVQGGGGGSATEVRVRLAAKGGPYDGTEHGRALFGPLGAADTLCVGPEVTAGRECAPTLRWNGRTWRGRARIFLGPRGKLTLALEIPLESYLLGVVPGEIGGLAESLLEAGRAQAVAARSYTLFYRGRRGAEGFDLYGTVEDQVYGPVESERALATRCVESTRGQVALFDGQPIRANYCSTCGGITADVREGWPAQNYAYLVGGRDRSDGEDFCAASPLYRWKEQWTAAEFLKTVAQYAPAESVLVPSQGIGDLLDVRIAARSRSGRVWRLEVITSTGRIVIPGYAVRRVLRRPGGAGSLLRSSLFKIDVRRDPATRRASAVMVSGAGSGHGVGLCQTGALGMARAAYKGEQILGHYYPGIALKRLY
jgi:stage II sporulation protein D